MSGPGPDAGSVIVPTAPVPDQIEQHQAGELSQQLLDGDVWTDEMVAAAGIPVVDAPLVSIGGGIGSFVLVDTLRIAGMPIEQVAVLTNLSVPWQTYEYLTKVSQIPRPERLRSDSSGRPDNIWGFPSYALTEARKEKTLAPLFSVALEPIFVDYWTPRAGTVFESLEKEMNRIRYQQAVRQGQVRMVRRRYGGGYFTINTPPPGTSATRRVAYRSRFVHIAVGYPGLKFLPDLQEFRERSGDSSRVVNAYEPHEHIYDALVARGGTVIVRGGGIVSSRVLQRLMEDRMNKGAQTRIFQLFRTFNSGNRKVGHSTRKGGDGYLYQGFNWPKSTWGGQLRSKLASLEGDERAALYKEMGGTHTPHRKLWQDQLHQSRSEGWYVAMQGEVDRVDQLPDGRLRSYVRSQNGASSEIDADYIIDATGLEADIRDHRLMADLLDHSGAGRNPLGRLDVERTFEIRGTRTEPGGRMYASGAMCLGGYYAGVDSFLGLQYAALQITDDLATQGFVRKIGFGRSLSQWWRWMRNRSVD